MISRVLVKRGEKSTEMLTELLNLDCGLGGDFYFPLCLSVFSAINNATYITYNKKLQETTLLLEKEKKSHKSLRKEPNTTSFVSDTIFT